MKSSWEKSGFLYVYCLDSDINVQLNSFNPFMHLAGVLICSLSKWELFELKRGEGHYNNKKPRTNFLNDMKHENVKHCRQSVPCGVTSAG